MMGGGGPPPEGQTRCQQCGGALSLEDLSRPACRYCGMIFAHVARAQEKVAIVHGLMGGALVPPPQAGQGPSPILPGVVMPGAPPSPPMTGGPVAVQIAQAPWDQGHGAAMQMHRRMVRIGILIAIGSVLFFTLLGSVAVWLLWH